MNVIIGPRGSGKTSVIELLRFCLDASAHAPRFETEAREHALSVLKDGVVTTTVTTQAEEVLVTRTVEEDEPRASGPYKKPIIFSQNEIEVVGLQALGRLRLVDGFISGRRRARTAHDALVAEIRSLTTELADLTNEILDLTESAKRFGDAPAELKKAEQGQRQAAKSVQKTSGAEATLERLGRESAAKAVGVGVLERTRDTLKTYQRMLRNLAQSEPRLEKWPAAAGPTDELQAIRLLVSRALDHLQEAAGLIEQASAQVQESLGAASKTRVEVEAKAREARRKVDAVREGAGAAAKAVAQLQERVGQLSALGDLIKQKNERVRDLAERRERLLDELDAEREQRFRDRKRVAGQLTQALRPAIEAAVERAAAFGEYLDALSASLRGSGLHYKNLAQTLAETMSPRELAEAVERNNPDPIVEASGLHADRASRVIAQLRAAGVGAILTADVQDTVTFSLLVGRDYRGTADLSMGQRCTVVLPILLSRKQQVIIVDQPEDHLDNAFIVGTLIKAIRSCKKECQIIFTTHNANIPVLGYADRVIVLGSDGKRGFKVHAGELDSPKSVSAITSIMEGGREAFEQRAKFYGQHADE